MDNLKGMLGNIIGSDNGEIKEKVEVIVSKISSSGSLLEKFKADPEKTIESLTGIDIPDAIADKVISGVKAALAGDKLDNLISKAKDLLGADDK